MWEDLQRTASPMSGWVHTAANLALLPDFQNPFQCFHLKDFCLANLLYRLGVVSRGVSPVDVIHACMGKGFF
jgi:hypothetical protein